MDLIHDLRHRKVGNTIENTRNQQDCTDKSGRDTDYIGVKINDQAGCKRKYHVACNIAHTISHFFRNRGFEALFRGSGLRSRRHTLIPHFFCVLNEKAEQNLRRYFFLVPLL